jgi:hypothetical protein
MAARLPVGPPRPSIDTIARVVLVNAQGAVDHLNEIVIGGECASHVVETRDYERDAPKAVPRAVGAANVNVADGDTLIVVRPGVHHPSDGPRAETGARPLDHDRGVKVIHHAFLLLSDSMTKSAG